MRPQAVLLSIAVCCLPLFSFSPARSQELTFPGYGLSADPFGGPLDALAPPATSPSGNRVSVNGGSVPGSLYGGWSLNGDAAGNELTINDGQTGRAIYGGRSDRGNVQDNSVIINGGLLGGGPLVFGGMSGGGEARGNSVTINAGSFGVDSTIYGGDAFTLSVNNRVTINRGWISGGAMGGKGALEAVGNALIINGGIVDGAPGPSYGAHSSYGGYSNGLATLNTVIIRGGIIRGAVYGGFSRAGDAVLNTVVLSGAADLSQASLYGGGTDVGAEVRRGNTLNVYASGLTAQKVENFQFYNFYLPAGVSEDVPLLTLTGGTSDFSADTLMVVGIAGGAALRPGASYTLVSNGGGLDVTGSTIQVLQGISLNYDITLGKSADGSSILATVAEDSLPELREETRIFAEGRAESLAFINLGGDLVAGLGLEKARQAALTGREYGLTPFLALSGASLRYRVGNGIRLDAAHALTGLARGWDVSRMQLYGGLFVETGWGRYRHSSSLTSGLTLHGKGEMHALGGGLLAGAELKDGAARGLYAEASFRAGHLGSDYTSHEVADFWARPASHRLSTFYSGAHAALGWRRQAGADGLFGRFGTDVQAAWLWSHEGGNSLNILDDPYRFAALNSQRLRLGMRLSLALPGGAVPYAEGAWEHEFAGRVRGWAYNLPLRDVSLRGDTGMLGLGLAHGWQNGFSLDARIQGFFGQRQGPALSVQMGYSF